MEVEGNCGAGREEGHLPRGRATSTTCQAYSPHTLPGHDTRRHCVASQNCDILISCWTWHMGQHWVSPVLHHVSHPTSRLSWGTHMQGGGGKEKEKEGRITHTWMACDATFSNTCPARMPVATFTYATTYRTRALHIPPLPLLPLATLRTLHATRCAHPISLTLPCEQPARLPTAACPYLPLASIATAYTYLLLPTCCTAVHTPRTRPLRCHTHTHLPPLQHRDVILPRALLPRCFLPCATPALPGNLSACLLQDVATRWQKTHSALPRAGERGGRGWLSHVLRHHRYASRNVLLPDAAFTRLCDAPRIFCRTLVNTS